MDEKSIKKSFDKAFGRINHLEENMDQDIKNWKNLIPDAKAWNKGLDDIESIKKFDSKVSGKIKNLENSNASNALLGLINFCGVYCIWLWDLLKFDKYDKKFIEVDRKFDESKVRVSEISDHLNALDQFLNDLDARNGVKK